MISGRSDAHEGSGNAAGAGGPSGARPPRGRVVDCRFRKTGGVYEDNLSFASMGRDIKGDAALTLSGSAGAGFLLD